MSYDTISPLFDVKRNLLIFIKIQNLIFFVKSLKLLNLVQK